MTISGVDPKCYILALFVRDDGTRFLLGDDPYEFKDKQLHFQPNTIANDVVEVQGNDGYLLAGQVRRPGMQSFDGYVGNGTNSKAEVEAKRRDFLQFFRRSHFYKVIYVFPNGTAIQRKQGFLVDDPTVQELYQQYPEYHVALNFEDVNYYTYEEDDQGHEIYAEEAIIRLVGGGATGGLIWDENGVVWESPWGESTTVSGTDFQVDNLLPVRVPISEVELQGNTTQQTYSGKNLLYGTNNTSGGITSTWDGSKVALSGTATSSYANITSANPIATTFPAGTYTFSTDSVTSVYSKVLRANWGGSNHDQAIAKDGKSITFTAPEDFTVRICFISGLSSGITIADSFGLQLEKGSTATSYEPYVGGIPAPNPDYPQDVQTVTGEQNVWVHGKNLLNPAIFDGIVDGGNGGYISSKYYTATTGVTFNLKPNTDYTISFRDMDGNLSSTAWSISINGTWKSLSGGLTKITTDGNGTFDLKIGASSYGNIGTSERVIQLEEGSSATAYEPYQGATYTIDLGAIELCKIGDYQDYIYKSGVDWYVHKECGKVVFNGSENWNYNTVNQVFGVSLDATFPLQTTTNPYCDNFIGQTTSTFAQVLDKHISLQSTATEGSQRVLVKDLDIEQSFDAFKTWLTTHNTTLYYPLATPTDTQITDSTLVGQLEALDAMRLFIGENNILVSASSPNLPATLQFDYYTQYLEPHGAEWEEGGTKGATIVNVDAIDNTYPVWELTGPAINPTLSVLTTNTTLTYNGTITASQTLVIDMFNKTATLNGTSVIGNVTGDFVYMAPGTNRVAYTAGNADAPDSKISWQEVVG